MWIYFFFSGLLVLLAVRFFEKMDKAKRIHEEFILNLKEKEEYYSSIIQEIEQGSYKGSITNVGQDIFLMIREETTVNVYPLNNQKKRNISLRQYETMKKKLDSNRTFYTFNIDSASVYYKFNAPYADYILRIDCY